MSQKRSSHQLKPVQWQETPRFTSHYVTSNARHIDEQWIGMDTEGAANSLLWSIIPVGLTNEICCAVRFVWTELGAPSTQQSQSMKQEHKHRSCVTYQTSEQSDPKLRSCPIELPFHLQKTTELNVIPRLIMRSASSPHATFTTNLLHKWSKKPLTNIQH
jgi:hypothetical protein